MKKLKVGEKEIIIEDNAIGQLTDDDLCDVCGGTGTGGGKYYSRMVCDQCNFASWWNPNNKEQYYLNDFHKQLGCYGTLRFETQYFETDPNLAEG